MRNQGFTLIEVMVAVVILAVGMASLFTSEAGAVRIAQRARTTTIATLLARCKMGEIEERYSDAEQSDLDGISIDYDDWHFNVRPSNTEPLLRLNLESVASREHMEEKRDEVLELIRG